jgi:hypothetical protein
MLIQEEEEEKSGVNITRLSITFAEYVLKKKENFSKVGRECHRH